MAQYVFINGVRYDESEVFDDYDTYESLDDWFDATEEIEDEKYERRRKDDDSC